MLKKTGRAFPRLNPRTIGKSSVLRSADAHEISVYICERAKTQDGRFPRGRLGPSWVQGEELADRTLLLWRLSFPHHGHRRANAEEN